jgi:subtilisin-like proprotein convertase family protein
MKKNYFLLLGILFITCTLFAQSPEDIKKITADYDMAKLKNTEVFYRKKEQEDKRKAIAVALTKNWPLIIKDANGNFSELMRLTPDGFPLYYSTLNVNAARITRANHLNSGGSLGLTLNGQGMVARVWDGGNVRASHNAFGGRVAVIDNPSSSSTASHPTHVCGTMVASASPAAVKGMAYQANARTFDWNSDNSEAISEAQLGMLISNHSYGVRVTNNGTTLPSWFIGAYTSEAFVWDELAYNAPYFLPVMSAGNDGTDDNNPDPILFGYDKLTTNKTAKNNLVVASCNDVSIQSNGTVDPSSIIISSFSSQGPTDDLRVKPDITGNGANLTSTSNTSNTATSIMSGTSMSSPNVAGTLVLIQQHFKNVTNSFMRAATLKGLACHTADDGGNIGPDANFGWGLLNAKKAVETITDNGLTSWISEEKLNTGQVFTMNVNSNGTTPLIASITWTDLPGPVNNGNLPANNATPALVNDLDIRITKNATTYFPWKLNSDPSLPAIRTGDNSVDNVEQVKIDAPTAGEYTVIVTSKGALVNRSQKYSLVITGINSAFAINSTSDNLTVCASQNAVYTFNYTQIGSGTTTFSAVDLPSGASASFSPATLSANGTVSMTITGLTNIAPNEYFIGIRGTSTSSETETRYKSLRVFNATFQPVTLQAPTNGLNGLSTSTNLKWISQTNAQLYKIQVSTSPNFTTFVIEDFATDNEYQLSGLSQATRYYWRIIPSNDCGTALEANAAVYSFDTGTLSCDQTFTATDFSNNFIDTIPNSEASVPLTITGGYTIGDIDVNVGITHSWIGDIAVTLEGPASIGSPVFTLLDIPCGNNQDISCTMDDNGAFPACSGIPAVSGNIKPLSPLNALNTLPADGQWILKVFDFNNFDGGTIDSFSINLCRVQVALAVVTNPILNSSVYPNPTKGIVNVSIPALTDKATINLYDLQGRQILSKETIQVDTTFGIENLQDGIYLVNIQNDLGAITKKIVLRRN